MGRVVSIAEARRKRAHQNGDVPVPPARGEFWRFDNLRGTKPRAHRLAERSPLGKALIAVGQVWVENGSKRLWVIREIVEPKRSRSSRKIILTPYYRKRPPRILAEKTLRYMMFVWEDYVVFSAGVEEKMRRYLCGERDLKELSEKELQVYVNWCDFFGIDPETGRVD